MMNVMVKSFVVIAILVGYGLAGDQGKTRTELGNGGGRRHYVGREKASRLSSATSLLKDPQLESFKFIHTAASNASEEVNAKLPSRSVATLRFHSGARVVRKPFKVKLSIPKMKRTMNRKLRGNVLFPNDISSVKGECKWNVQRGNGRKVLFIPRACIKMIKKLDITSLLSKKVFGLLVPKKNKQFGLKKRKITKNFVLITYGKRMEALLRRLAVKKQSTRLIVSSKRHGKGRK